MADELANNMPAEQPAPVPEQKSKKSTIVRIVIALVIAAIAAGGYSLIKDATFSGSNISTSDLVDETYENIAFKRPSGWTRVEVQEEGVDIAFTEGGEQPDETDQGIILATESLGIDYAELSSEQKELLSSQFITQFSNASELENDTCQKAEDIVSAETSREGYDTIFTVEARCTQLKDRPTATATIKMIIGVAGEDLHLMVMVALDETWEKSAEALDEVYNSLRPV